MSGEPFAWLEGRERDHAVRLTGHPWRLALCGRLIRLRFLTRLSTDTNRPCATCQKRLKRGLTTW